MWTWDTSQLTFDQTCWTFDGANFCIDRGGGGYPAPHTGPRKSPYHFLDKISLRAVKECAEKVEAYKEAKKEINPETIEAIVSSMVDTWPKQEMAEAMELHQMSRDLAILAYKATLSKLIVDDDLALLLIIAST